MMEQVRASLAAVEVGLPETATESGISRIVLISWCMGTRIVKIDQEILGSGL